MIIDIHQHIEPQLGRELSAPAVEAHARACGVDWMVVSNPVRPSPKGRHPDETDANLACLTACEAGPRLLPLYWARPGSLDSHVPAFTGALTSEPFVGAVFPWAPDETDLEAAVERLEPYLAVLAQLELPALLHLGGESTAAFDPVIDIARRYPRTSFVLCGVGGDRNWAAAVGAVQRADVRLYLDTAGAQVENVTEAVRAAGVGRLVFGSGGTLLDDAHAHRCRALLEQLQERLTPVDFERLATQNARVLFRIPTA